MPLTMATTGPDVRRGFRLELHTFCALVSPIALTTQTTAFSRHHYVFARYNPTPTASLPLVRTTSLTLPSSGGLLGLHCTIGNKSLLRGRLRSSKRLSGEDRSALASGGVAGPPSIHTHTGGDASHAVGVTLR